VNTAKKGKSDQNPYTGQRGCEKRTCGKSCYRLMRVLRGAEGGPEVKNKKEGLKESSMGERRRPAE